MFISFKYIVPFTSVPLIIFVVLSLTDARNISSFEVINKQWIRVVIVPEKKTTNVRKYV